MNGILFTTDNHKAIRDKLKTQTRRLDHLKKINKIPDMWFWQRQFSNDKAFFFSGNRGEIIVKPRYRVGEIVYIKEIWAIGSHSIDYPNRLEVLYKTTHDDNNDRQWVTVDFDTWVKYAYKNKWRSPMFMPSWATRTFIKITDVRPERLQDITEEDAQAEGTPFINVAPNPQALYPDINGYRRGFVFTWNEISGKAYPFDGNYWVWRICFNLIEDKR